MERKANYQKELDKILEKIPENSEKPSLLLHACCGPCSSYVLEYLAKFFDITILYYNPNIYPDKEYHRRLNELKNLLPRFPEAVKNDVKLVELSYNPEEFFAAIDIKKEPQLAEEPEKGERCRRCYKFRLKKSYEYAKENHFQWFCTTLSISPFKDSEKINTIGKELTSADTNPDSPKWLPSDFKKKNGFKRSLELSEEYNLFRQQYCGCVFSKINTEKFRDEKNFPDPQNFVFNL